MTLDEFKNATAALLGMVAADNQAAASEQLTALSDAFEQNFNALETANGNVTKLTENNEKLRKTNMDLFLRVGSTKQEKETPEKGATDKDGGEPLNYNDLFNEKGELK